MKGIIQIVCDAVATEEVHDPPKFIRGVRLNESGVRSKYNVTVVGVKSPGKPFRYAEANTVVTNHDLIIVSGTNVDIERFAGLDR